MPVVSTQIVAQEAWEALQDAILYVQRTDGSAFGVRTRAEGFVRTYKTACGVGTVYAARVPGVGIVRKVAGGWRPPRSAFAYPGLVEAVRGAIDAA